MSAPSQAAQTSLPCKPPVSHQFEQLLLGMDPQLLVEVLAVPAHGVLGQLELLGYMPLF